MIRLMGLLNHGKSFQTENVDHPDHEVSMAHNLLDDIIKSATELKMKMGQDEKDVPAWIQDHISQAQNFINQAATNYHEHEAPEQDVSPEPVSELTPTAISAYKGAATQDRNRAAQDYYEFSDIMSPDERKATEKRIDKRSKGIRRANTKLNPR